MLTERSKYEAYLGKSITDRYHDLNRHCNELVDQANAQIQSLQEKIGSKTTSHAPHWGQHPINTLSEMQEDRAILLQKFNELHNAYKEKSKAHANLKKLYDAGKAKEMAINVQDAAEDDADETLLAGAANRFHDRMGTGTGIGGQASHFPMNRHGVEQIHSRQRSGGSGGMEGDARFASHWPQPGTALAQTSR